MLDVDKLLVLRAVAAQGSIAARRTRAGLHPVGHLPADVRAGAGGRRGTADPEGNAVTVTPPGRRLLEHTERILSSSEPRRRPCAMPPARSPAPCGSGSRSAKARRS